MSSNTGPPTTTPVRPPATQDLAPKGGYPSIRFRRDVPHRSVSATLVGCALMLTTTVGLFRLASVWRERRELKREKMWGRLYILPLIQAEWDREWMKWRAEQVAKEAEIMKNVPGWVAGESFYSNERWAPPAFDLDGNPVRAPVIRYVDSGEPL